MAGATNREYALDGIDLNTLVVFVCLAVFLGGAVTLALGIEYGLLLLVFGLGGVAIGLDAIPGESSSKTADETERDPLSVLRKRYARGELTDGEFERRLDRLLETEPDNSARERVDREPIAERS